MGGFVVESRILHTLEPFHSGNVEWLLTHHPDLLPNISEKTILDKSKADWFSKAVALGQASWFCLNCIARLTEGLPVSLLEVTTFAHALCALLTYILWWHKPLSVQEPIVLKFVMHVDDQYSSEGRGFKAFLLETSATCVIAAVYGAPHIAALNSTFPTAKERTIWFAASICVALFPILNVFMAGILLFVQAVTGLRLGLTITAFLGPLLYLIPSTFLLIESFRQLWFLPPSAYQLTSWVSYIPHFS